MGNFPSVGGRSVENGFFGPTSFNKSVAVFPDNTNTNIMETNKALHRNPSLTVGILDFSITESQNQIKSLNNGENKCSQITKFLFVGDKLVAENLGLLENNNITRIINCSSAAVECSFLNNKKYKYLSLNLVDGRGEDLSWFFCEIAQFILQGKKKCEKILLHCHKGISRSCSFAILFYMLWKGTITSFFYFLI
jgi:protein-tyrosine phosphatase